MAPTEDVRQGDAEVAGEEVVEGHVDGGARGRRFPQMPLGLAREAPEVADVRPPQPIQPLQRRAARLGALARDGLHRRRRPQPDQPALGDDPDEEQLDVARRLVGDGVGPRQR